MPLHNFGGEYYQVHGDWAGVASGELESIYEGAVALCTIGCGADANPEPRGAPEYAQQHGKSVAQEVVRLLEGATTAIDESIVSNFDYAGLSFDLPAKSELEGRLGQGSIQSQRNAQHLLDVYEKEGRLPATYPVPIQTWKFGDDLTMIFLGGEVVVDYALRLKKELDNTNLWVTAYSNDVLGYICSQRMRQEEGYEFRESGVFYNLPGPWADGTEDLFIARIKEVLATQQNAGNLSPEQSLGQISVPEHLTVELVAAEPLIQDPINIAFGNDGKLWVVEMGDYPNGGQDGKSLGRIKYLSDRDGDGRFDDSTVFLDQIAFPTGVLSMAQWSHRRRSSRYLVRRRYKR